MVAGYADQVVLRHVAAAVSGVAVAAALADVSLFAAIRAMVIVQMAV